MSFIYVMSPYTHENPIIEDQRYEQVLQYTALWISRGFNLYSPIVHTHHLHRHMVTPPDHKQWLTFDLEMMRHAKECWLLKLEGWEFSKGCMIEHRAADAIGLRVYEKEYVLK